MLPCPIFLSFHPLEFLHSNNLQVFASATVNYQDVQKRSLIVNKFDYNEFIIPFLISKIMEKHYDVVMH